MNFLPTENVYAGFYFFHAKVVDVLLDSILGNLPFDIDKLNRVIQYVQVGIIK
jgi:hypothetical protein